jgi:hypothetical protein
MKKWFAKFGAACSTKLLIATTDGGDDSDNLPQINDASLREHYIRVQA